MAVHCECTKCSWIVLHFYASKWAHLKHVFCSRFLSLTISERYCSLRGCYVLCYGYRHFHCAEVLQVICSVSYERIASRFAIINSDAGNVSELWSAASTRARGDWAGLWGCVDFWIFHVPGTVLQFRACSGSRDKRKKEMRRMYEIRAGRERKGQVEYGSSMGLGDRQPGLDSPL